MFFSCENNFEDVKLINKDSKIPVGVSDNFILKYSDSASLKAVLESPKNIDFTKIEFGKAQKRKSDRSHQELSNEYLVAELGLLCTMLRAYT